jgi:nucleotide-binding universal stress UspA family protein
MHSINKILVPTDFSDNGSHAYSYAQQIAGRYGAKVDFIHIIPTLQYFSESLEQLSMPLDMEQDVYPYAQKRTSGKLKKLMDSYLQPENKGDGIVRIAPNPSKTIAKYAEQDSYDLIVLTTHKRNGIKHRILKSTTEKIVQLSVHPVVTINPDLVSAA